MNDLDPNALFFHKIQPNLIDISFRDIGGYEEVKETLTNYAQLLEKVSILKKWKQQINGKILLYGPPGTGKTTLVKALAKETKVPLFLLNVTQVLSKYLSETGKNMESAFEKMKDGTKAIVFIDEFDSLAKTRDSMWDHDEHKRVVNTLLQILDSISLTEDQILLIAATNFETILDSAVWRRFDILIQVRLPEFRARKKILRILIDGIPKDEKNSLDLTEISELTDGWSGADLKRLITKAVVDRLVKDSHPKITTLRLKEIITKKIITATAMRKSYDFDEMRNRSLGEESNDFFDNTFLQGEKDD